MPPKISFSNTCTIMSRVSGTDAYEQPVDTYTTTLNIPCRFVSPKKQVMWQKDGVFIQSLAKCMFPPTVTINELDKISSTVPGFIGPFFAKDISIAYGKNRIVADHKTCSLEVVK